MLAVLRGLVMASLLRICQMKNASLQPQVPTRSVRSQRRPRAMSRTLDTRSRICAANPLRLLARSARGHGERGAWAQDARWGDSGLSAQERMLSRLLAAHPLQVHAGRNQLQPLLVTVADRELLHARRSNATRGAAPHAVRARCGALLDLQVREFPGEASILAVLRQQPSNLFLTLLPAHSDFRASFRDVCNGDKHQGANGKVE